MKTNLVRPNNELSNNIGVKTKNTNTEKAIIM